MKINFIPCNFAFKSDSIPKLPKEGITMGYDDYESSMKRKALREHLEDSLHLGYQDYYELPKSDDEMERMLKSWGLKVDHITKKITVPPYFNVIPLGNNNFRGALPDGLQKYKDLKESGITTIICAEPRSWIRKSVENNGLNYIDLVCKHPTLADDSYIFDDMAFYEEELYMYKLKDDYDRNSKYEESYAKLLSDEEHLEARRKEFRTKSRDFIDELIKAVCAWQKGCCFIGCSFGLYLTNSALSVIDAFNPKGKGIDSRYLCCMEKDLVVNLYKKLTPQDKKLMGWTKEFEKAFQKRFVNI